MSVKKAEKMCKDYYIFYMIIQKKKMIILSLYFPSLKVICTNRHLKLTF